MRLKDWTGQKVGKLTVIGRAPNKILPSGKSLVMWYCICECDPERQIIVSSDYLRESECPSCGCEALKNRIEKNRTDNIGQKFWRLEIVDVIYGDGPAKAVCKCDCGSDYIGIKADIVSGHTKSCGCLQSENTSAANTKDWTGYIAESGVKFIRQDHMNNKGQWIWECECPLCGNPFYELPAKVNDGHTTSCGCRVQSFGESYVKSILEENGVDFKTQYTFDDCKYVSTLFFDFGILNNGELIGLIEYDGRQHFEPIDFFGGEEGFKKSQARDNVKNKYCQLHNIPLLRLPYTLSLKEIKTKVCEYYLSLTTAGDIWQHVS